MAYDAALDERVQEVVSSWGAVRRAMFGGTGYMIRGHLFAGVYKDRLLVRLSPTDGDAALKDADVVAFDMMPRPMPGWVTVGQAALDAEGLEAWLRRGRAYAESLPTK